MGADPIVSTSPLPALARGSPIRRSSAKRLLVRKAEKAHALAAALKGFLREGARVVIVDDVCTPALPPSTPSKRPKPA